MKQEISGQGISIQKLCDGVPAPAGVAHLGIGSVVAPVLASRAWSGGQEARSARDGASISGSDGVPMFAGGWAGGRVKSGLHIDGVETAGTRLGSKMMKLFGVKFASWGTRGKQMSKETQRGVA